MSQARSPSTQQVYGLVRVCRVWEVARSTVYATKGRAAVPAEPPRRRGPKPRWSDETLLSEIRAVLAAAVFLGEGHRKVWARLRWKGGADLEGAGTAADAGGAPAGAHADGPRPWAEGARRDDHHGAARSDVGDGCHELSDPRRGSRAGCRRGTITAAST